MKNNIIPCCPKIKLAVTPKGLSARCNIKYVVIEEITL